MPHPPRIITANGRSLTLAEWATETGHDPKTICSRIDLLGWTPERALSAPADKRFRRGGRPKVGGQRPAPRVREKHGKAFVRWRDASGERYRSFGAWGSKEAATAYQQFAAEWNAGAVMAVDTGEKITVAGVVSGWLVHTEAFYTKLGKPTSETHVSRAAVAKLLDLYGGTPAELFTPARLKAVRAALVKDGKTRKTVNGYAYRIVRCFRWAAAESLIPPGVHLALAAVENLKPGRTAAPDRPPVKAVSDADIEAVLAALPDTRRGHEVAAMIELQRIAGLRPQHLSEMRPQDLDTTGDVWAYLPPESGTKTLHQDRRPVFYFGPKAQPYLALRRDRPTVFGYWLTPTRWVKITPNAYAKAIRRACDAAGIPRWHPHQLRHAAATDIARQTESADKAAALIGDNLETARAVYIHTDPQERTRRELARQFG